MFKQIELPYEFKSLEPHIDELTMITHYTKHHASYTASFNAAVEKAPAFADHSAEEIFVALNDLSDIALKSALQNNGGGFYNHNLYFSTLSADGGTQPNGVLLKQIEKVFQSFDALKKQLTDAAIAQFGSGWAWLSANSSGDLKVSSSPNQGNPIMESGGEWTPILALDVWEHAYYLTYKNLRADYLKALFNVINWQQVEKNYEKICK